MVEIVVNGKPVEAREVLADGEVHDLEFEIEISRSSWVALRQFPQLHTNPVNVLVGDKPIRASRASALWCNETIEQLWRTREKSIAESERVEARQSFESARERFRHIAGEAVSETRN